MSQLQQLWGGWSLVQRISIVGAAVLSVAAVIGVGMWSMQSQYVPLAADLTPTAAAELVSALDSAGIPSRLNFSGSSILVPKQDLSRARLASGKLIDVAGTAGEDIEGSVWSDPSLHHVRLLRQQEQRLARSIAQFEFIRSATVHLSVPEPSPFIREQSQPTASVVVDLKSGASANRQDGAAIVALVAHSVEGLDPSRVTVMDTRGRILSSEEAVEGDVAGQLEYRRRMETELAAKAETLLSQMLGQGHAVVRVTADIDFTETQREVLTYDPESKVTKSETIKSEVHSGGKSSTGGGAPGASSNGGTSSGSGGTTKIEENTSEYANAETKNTIHEAPGKLIRLTVASVVQLPEKSADGAASAITVDSVKQLIQQAVGFDVARGDQIQVVDSPLAGAMLAAPEPTAVPWEQYEKLARAASLGLAAVVAFVMGWLLLRRFRPTIATTAAPAVGDDTERLAALSLRARENPEAVAQAISAWLSASRTADQPQTVPFRKAS
jgi:flagellar M-ring protein FliF